MSSDLQTRLTEAEKSFKKACEQILQLNRRLDEMAKRYDKASRENHRSFRYSLRLRMAVSEGVRNMYYEYAANKADVITNLRCQVLQAVGDGNQNLQGALDTDRGEGEEREEEANEDSSPIIDLAAVQPAPVEVGDVSDLGDLMDDSPTEDEDEEESVPVVRGISVGQERDSSDTEGFGSGSGSNENSEASGSADPGQVEEYFTNDGGAANSRPVLTSSPVAYMSTSS